MKKPIRHIILAGMPRSGKSTLARRLANRFALTHLPLDSLVNAFEKTFPELGISNDSGSFGGLCDRINPFLNEFLSFYDRQGIGFLFDAYYFRPSDIASLRLFHAYSVFFFGYPNLDVNARVKLLRERETSADWTSLFDDSTIIRDLSRFKEASKQLEYSCKDLGLQFIDVSSSWDERLDECLDLCSRFLAEGASAA